MLKVQKEMKALQMDWLSIDKELKLFNFYFFNHWRGEASRDAVRAQGCPIVASEDLFYVISGVGHVEQPVLEVVPPPQREPDLENGLLSAIEEFSGGMFGGGAGGSNQVNNNNNSQGRSQQPSVPAKTQYFLVFNEPLSNEMTHSQEVYTLGKG